MMEASDATDGPEKLKVAFVSPSLRDRRLRIEVNNKESILSIKRLLCMERELSGIDPSELRLIYLGRIIADSSLVSGVLRGLHDGACEPVMNILFSGEAAAKVSENLKEIATFSTAAERCPDVSEANADEQKVQSPSEQKTSEHSGASENGTQNQENPVEDTRPRGHIKTFHRVFLPTAEGQPMIVNIK